MNPSNNEKVQIFLNEIQVIDPMKLEMLLELRQIIFDVFPKSEERMMYGGILFSNASEFYAGLFVRKNHISLEFSKGFLMNDPDNHLEGGGKYRRHLKISTHTEIHNKKALYYIKQAI